MAHVAGSLPRGEMGTSVKFFLSDPNAEITIDSKVPGGRIVCGSSDLETEIKIYLKSDTAQRLWSGKLSVLSAILSGELTVKGPVEKLQGLLSTFKPALQIYRGVLAEVGRDDLLQMI